MLSKYSECNFPWVSRVFFKKLLINLNSEWKTPTYCKIWFILIKNFTKYTSFFNSTRRWKRALQISLTGLKVFEIIIFFAAVLPFTLKKLKLDRVGTLWMKFAFVMMTLWFLMKTTHVSTIRIFNLNCPKSQALNVWVVFRIKR